MLLAVMEGVCFALRDCVELARAAGASPSFSTVSGGGARSELWMRILANVLNLEIRIPETEEGPALGGVKLAAAAAEGSKEPLFRREQAIRRVVRPDPAIAARYEKKYRNYQKIYPQMKSLFQDLKGN